MKAKEKGDEVNKGRESQLTCYGCAYSEPSGKPSKKNPCHFCIRNPNRDYVVTKWYDGTEPIKIPMDCYISTDMHEQVHVWMKALLRTFLG